MTDNTVTTKLLTLLNVSATKIGKRKRFEDEFVPAEKLNKRKASISFAQPKAMEKVVEAAKEIVEASKDVEMQETVEEADDNTVDDGYEKHFGLAPSCLSESSRSAVENQAWSTLREKNGKLGSAIVSIPAHSEASTSSCTSEIDILESLKAPFLTRQAKQAKNQGELQHDILSTLSTRKDLYITATPLETKRCTREAIALHALNHVSKKRRRVLKNNERLTRAAKANPDAPPLEDVQDQGFTRPSVLILLPFRSSALDWFRAITSHTPPPTFQVENQSRFLSEYGLPEGAIDKLVTAEPGTYPPDHVDTFKGNVDDNFRVGIKLTRKTIKMFADFYGCDIIIASPLGLRRSIEKEHNADYLTSIEVLVIDQMDALTMQNWEHVKFVMNHINKLPKESHDTDFSRIKPWYLDGFAPYLRQSILLSAYETAETRSLYNNTLKNVEGKIRTEKHWPPIEVPAGIDQNFVHFDCVSPVDEPEKRFQYFTTQLLSSVLKSAVQSTNTIVFIPSSFDFIRVQNYFRKHSGVSFTVLSEYSTNQDISRARQAFFSGDKSFLLMSERFHFYKRYKIRGSRNILFYGPPDHPQYFTELLSFPFLDDGVEPSDVTCRVLFSKYDRFRLERIVGTEAAIELIKSS
ncbi:U3 small nucleolar RNA-associated protein 25 [Psilocybe cubensis]|uniref:U3 small nucleolar RNA-associated protein 25 n=2 Tax=Psilocybe cubensis TaxID=181762 RepID=A0ACB8HC74_PSICU|nr:U3 small nucleolar RNA-associated protein 25 [Psilocybe cubensis]KAH9484760.1 U3 small nucleolar RNA-associated protein 25 [Psilocybe cubensis]